MNLVISILFSIFDVLVFTSCAVGVVLAIPTEVKTARWKRVAAWGGYGALSVLLPLLRNDVLTIAVLTIYYIVIGRLLYYRNKMGYICQAVYCLLMLATQYMAIFFVVQITYLVELSPNIYMHLIVVLKALFLTLVTLVFREIIRKRFVDGHEYVKIRGMIIVPVFSMILIFLYFVSSDVFLLRFGYYWILIFSGLLLIINLYCFYFWYDVSKNGELKHRLKLMQQQNELTLQYYEDMEKNYNRSRKVIHDIRNHLHAIEQAGQMENHGYIEDVHEMLNSLGMRFYTENRMLNIILNDKLKNISREKVECRLGGIDLEFISDMDITTIFANLLDNAVEAQPLEQCSIKIRGEQIQDFVVIKISNPFQGTYAEGKSTKKGHEGFGLQNVSHAVKKYHGEIEIEHKNQVFSVTLAFPMINL